MGWFYGLKLHFAINHKGQIMALKITPGNTADSTVLDAMTRHLTGKLYADKGYIGQNLFKPESAGYQQFCDHRRTVHRLWQRQIAVTAGKERSKPPTEALHC